MDLRVDLAELRRAGDDVYETRSDLSDEWELIRSKAKALFGSSWTGTAASSYAEPWGDCEDGFTQILASLASLSQSLDEAAEQYQAKESQNAAAINRTTALGGLNLDV